MYYNTISHMERVRKILPELGPKKIKKNVERFWKIYINPPKERGIFLSPENLPILFEKKAINETEAQPKQVVYDENSNKAYVSCMEGYSLQIFDIHESSISLEKTIEFEDQCVEVLLDNNLLFVTTTNFDRPPHQLRNKLWILNPKDGNIISSIDTGGNWSKLIAARPQHNELLVSNWHSHNISSVDITNPKNPQVKQILKWGEAPRGIAFTSDGNTAVITGFYSGNLGLLKRSQEGIWKSEFTSEKFDSPHYSGNMRHILITEDDKTAIVSNLGRNMIHIWDIEKRKFKNSILVGKSPNSIYWLDSNQIAVSCRESSFVYIVDLNENKVIGKSQKTGKEPTGLCEIKGGFLVTCFESNTIELHKIKK